VKDWAVDELETEHCTKQSMKFDNATIDGLDNGWKPTNNFEGFE
jgi:hypothetical protein